MTETRDELAGVVDLFGALTCEELTTALSELAFKRGEQADEDDVAAAVESAIDGYALVVVDDADIDGGDADGGAKQGDADGDAKQGDADANAARVEADDEQWLVPGPTAFPALPPAAEDLPHIMDVPQRTIDRDAMGDRVRDRLRREAEAAIDAGDHERAEQLLDVSYDLEAWAPVEAEEIRATLDEQLSE